MGGALYETIKPSVNTISEEIDSFATMTYNTRKQNLMKSFYSNDI